MKHILEIAKVNTVVSRRRYDISDSGVIEEKFTDARTVEGLFTKEQLIQQEVERVEPGFEMEITVADGVVK